MRRWIIITLLCLMPSACHTPRVGVERTSTPDLAATPIPTAILSPPSSVSVPYPPPRPSTPTAGPYPPPTSIPVPVTSEPPTPTPTHGPSPTPSPSPSPTLTPTWPVIVPPTATPVLPSAQLTAADLLPRGAMLLAEVVADLEGNGQESVVLLYRFPLTLGGDLHLVIYPLSPTTSYQPETRPIFNQAVSLTLQDINGDGQLEVITQPLATGYRPFTCSGIGSWLQIHNRPPWWFGFKGGHFQDPGGMAYVVHLRPILYHAGPKQMVLLDEDRDGIQEFEVSYSLEAGAETWQVDRYRWDGTEYVYTSSTTHPAQEILSPAQFKHVQNLLFPSGLPMTCQGYLTTGRLEILAIDWVQWNLAEAPMPLITYLLRAQKAIDFGYMDGEAGLALFSPDYQNLLWKSPLSSSFSQAEMMDDVQSYAVLIHPSPDQKGLLWHLIWTISGSGRLRWSETGFYRWTGGEFIESWRRITYNGGGMGICCGSYTAEDVWLEDVDGDGWVEVLLKRVEEMRQLEWAHRAVNYALHFPGAVAFRWDGAAYVPAYWVDNGRVTPIRPRLPMYFAPRLSFPLTIDGDGSDWAQIEYKGSMELEPDESPPHPEATAAWDEQRFYLITKVAPGRIITLTLDTDLAHDFTDATLNADDVVLEAVVPAEPGCQGRVEVCFRHPVQEPTGVRAAMAPLPHSLACTLELAIPLETLGLAGQRLVPVPGWVSGGLKPEDYREYYPRAGLVIGFALAVDGQALSPGFRANDPTTWNTLVLMADR